MNPTQELQNYLDQNGRITRFPGKRQKKKVMLMLKYLAGQFETNRTYTETEVNDTLNQYHTFNDPAILRRLLFVRRMMHRTSDGRKYWKADSTTTN